jgi:hypothetical protein
MYNSCLSIDNNSVENNAKSYRNVRYFLKKDNQIEKKNKKQDYNLKTNNKSQNSPVTVLSNREIGLSSNINTENEKRELARKVIPDGITSDDLIDMGEGLFLTQSEIIDFSQGADS